MLIFNWAFQNFLSTLFGMHLSLIWFNFHHFILLFVHQYCVELILIKIKIILSNFIANIPIRSDVELKSNRIQYFLMIWYEYHYLSSYVNWSVHLFFSQSSTPTCVDINGKLDSTMRTSEMWEAHAVCFNFDIIFTCILKCYGLIKNFKIWKSLFNNI